MRTEDSRRFQTIMFLLTPVLFPLTILGGYSFGMLFASAVRNLK